MDSQALDFLHVLFKEIARQPDWLSALDTLFVSLRGDFVFDNVAIFRPDQRTGVEAVYARAVGRGKTAEADATWGGELAGQVFATGKTAMQTPREGSQEKDRLKLAYLLGLPMQIGWRLGGALVFTRFGGPPYTDEHLKIADVLASWASSLLAHHGFQQAQEQLDSVQQQMRLQDDFVSTISHELKTPLGFIKGYSTSLLRQDTTWDESTKREFLGIIDEESDRLTNLIDHMLESARLQSHSVRFKFAPLRLDALVRDVAARVTSQNPELQVAFDMEDVPPIQGDSNRLTQVFENLFSNALKYAPNAAITVRMRREPSGLHCIFADNGEGIPDDYLPFLFERFYRVPGDRGVTGTGLGLYICKQIVLAHRGKIWAESNADRGAAFHIELPVPAAA